MPIDWARMTIDERVNLLRSTGKFRSVGECRRLASAGPEVLKRVVEEEHFFSEELKDYLETWNTVLNKGAILVNLSDKYKQVIAETLAPANPEEKQELLSRSYEIMSDINSAVFELRQAQLHLIGMILNLKEKSIHLLTKLDEDYETRGESENDVHDSIRTT